MNWLEKWTNEDGSSRCDEIANGTPIGGKLFIESPGGCDLGIGVNSHPKIYGCTCAFLQGECVRSCDLC